MNKQRMILRSEKKKLSDCFSPSTRAATQSNVSETSSTIRKGCQHLLSLENLMTEDNRSTAENEEEEKECVLLINRINKVRNEKIICQKKRSDEKRKQLTIDVENLTTQVRKKCKVLFKKKTINSNYNRENKILNIEDFTYKMINRNIERQINKEKDEIDKMKYELKSLNKETYNINSTSKQLKEELNEEKKVTEELKKNINNCIEEKKNLTTETILIDNRIIKVKKQLEELMKRYVKYKKQLRLLDANLNI